MANLLQAYSLNTGFKINKLKPHESFYPTPEKYITLQTSSGMESKNYDYWLDVLEYIHPVVEKEGYTIVHIGRDCEEFPYCHNLINKTNLNQTNYVLRNSKLHFGNDSFAIHLAGEHGVPVVGLYGPTTPANHGPHFSVNSIFLESHRDDKNPSFAAQEEPKTINYIKPEDVANSIFKLLGLKERVEDKTIFIGPQYGKHFIEVIPNVAVNPQALQGHIPTLRCDYFYNEEFVAQNLSMHPYAIITDKNTPLELYKQFKENIQTINYKVSKDTNLSYIKALINIGIPIRLWTDDEENINDIRFKFLDIEQVHLVTYKDFDINLKGKKYKSFKYLLSDGKIYMSKSDWLKDRPIPNPQENLIKVEKTLDFCKELEYYRIIE
jgi:hypothetical protein